MQKQFRKKLFGDLLLKCLLHSVVNVGHNCWYGSLGSGPCQRISDDTPLLFF